MTATVAVGVRCWQCKRLLAELVSPPWKIVCPRCKAENKQGLDSRKPAAVR